ncbi:MAG TPA: rhodanese family protein [Brevundimonas sp.]|uniref:rhodanese family protein n=1 Tax=Brevundimonas sp. TaxID=1871086 RepID=UPI00260FF556|nr:rhodanese family protein [Brevundimonas sp.]HRO34002.1 rhodanese family protein [Brevundimonas sp.]
MSVLIPLSPADVADRLKRGDAVLVDIREPDEAARERIAQATSAPLSAFEAAHLELQPGREVVFMCRTGNRTGVNCDRLASRVLGDAYVLEGGLEAWKAAGLPTVVNRKAPLELMRQVQMAAGALVLLGVALGLWVHPAFWALAAFVGAGLFVAGATGFCGMARLLAVMPWNRPAARTA